MPVYDYLCQKCGTAFDVTKRIAEIDVVESCPECKSECDSKARIISTPKEFFGEKPEEPFYSVPLGKWVKGKSDLRKQAKARGMIEIGNENVDNMIKRDDRYIQEKCDRRYREVWDTSITVRG
jgi:putative FmdB family regulatory protein